MTFREDYRVWYLTGYTKMFLLSTVFLLHSMNACIHRLYPVYTDTKLLTCGTLEHKKQTGDTKLNLHLTQINIYETNPNAAS